MDPIKMAREIGFFNVGKNISDYMHMDNVKSMIENVIPLPDYDIRADAQEAAEWLVSMGKSMYVFLNPEMELIKNISIICNENDEAVIIIPHDMDGKSRERMVNNLPKTMNVSVMDEGFFPAGCGPANGIIISTGYLAGGRIMMLPETYRMAESYNKKFMGRKVFVPYRHIDTGIRYRGWLEADPSLFKSVWFSREKE